MIRTDLDHGKAFDWGRASKDYAKFRDIYPPEFYQNILDLDLCTKGQRVLDLGTGTGVLPRNLASCGAQFTGVDIAENQILEARRLTEEAGLSIDYQIASAECLPFPAESFDTVTACQCFFYFEPASAIPQISAVLKPGGRLAILYLNWLPSEDPIAAASEALVLKYNPDWTGAHYTRTPLPLPSLLLEQFERETARTFDLSLPFTEETWNGRIKACRGIGASSLSQEQIEAFSQEHLNLLRQIAPKRFSILHNAAIDVFRVRKQPAL